MLLEPASRAHFTCNSLGYNVQKIPEKTPYSLLVPALDLTTPFEVILSWNECNPDLSRTRQNKKTHNNHWKKIKTFNIVL